MMPLMYGLDQPQIPGQFVPAQLFVVGCAVTALDSWLMAARIFSDIAAGPVFTTRTPSCPTDTVMLVWLGQRRIPGIESGRTLPYSQDYSFSAGVAWTQPLWSDWTLQVRPSYTYIGPYAMLIVSYWLLTQAVAMLAKGDVLLVAGKGHETGQIVGDRVLPFDDALVARECAS